MRVLIRFLRRGPAGSIEQRDKLFDGDVLTLGRATDQVVQLKDRRVALAHARISLRGGQAVLQSRVPAGVLVNGALCRETRLQPGDTVALGANILRIQEPEPGCELCFSFELDPGLAADGQSQARPTLRLTKLGLGKRAWSWVLFVAVLAGALIVPATGVQYPAVRDSLRASALPDDGFWSPGPLAGVHGMMAENCEACHQQPFERVRNDACLDCHAPSLHRHTGRRSAAAQSPIQRLPVVLPLEEARCASCHAEHHEPATLVRRDPAICIDCHQDLAAVADWSQVAPVVTDFLGDHPDFALDGEDASGLRFPHAEHLKEGGVRSPVGDTVLGCGDCHVPEPGGARFRPLAMERDCGGCHLLDFDPAFPRRVVPHGDVAAVTAFLVDHYSRRYLEDFADPEAQSVDVRRPGRQLSSAERARLLKTAGDEARAVARDLIERRSCSQCHEVTAGSDRALPWQIAPVKIRTAWLPGAQFSHARHSTALTDCTTCHAATESVKASDILMPTIATCRDCHGSGEPRQNPASLITSTCVLCHAFHPAGNPLWQPAGP